MISDYRIIRILSEIHNQNGYIVAYCPGSLQPNIGEIHEQSKSDVYFGARMLFLAAATRKEFERQLRAVGLRDEIKQILPSSRFYRVQVLD